MDNKFLKDMIEMIQLIEMIEMIKMTEMMIFSWPVNKLLSFSKNLHFHLIQTKFSHLHQYSARLPQVSPHIIQFKGEKISFFCPLYYWAFLGVACLFHFRFLRYQILYKPLLSLDYRVFLPVKGKPVWFVQLYCINFILYK